MKGGNLHSPNLQKWSFTIKCNLESYLGQIFFFFFEGGVVLPLSRGFSQGILSLTDRAILVLEE